MIFQRPMSLAYGDRRTALLPRIAKQPQAWVAQRLLRWRGVQDRLPASILIDVERALVQAFAGGKMRFEIVALPQMLGVIGKRMNTGR